MAAGSSSAGSAPIVWRRVGILGGGQLGLMMADAGRRLNVHTTVLDPTEACPASKSADCHVLGSFKDGAKIKALAAISDVLTVEIEHVDAIAYGEGAEAAGIPAEPRPETVLLIQDKLTQKEHFATVGVPLGPFQAVSTLVELLAAGEEFGWPLMLKSRCGAYDGKGNAVVKEAAGAPDAVRVLLSEAGAAAFLSGAGCPGREGLYVEAWVPFIRELAVMVARSTTGECVAYPVVETVHQDNVCHVVIAPAQVSVEVAARAVEAALCAVRSLHGAGVFGVELFQTTTGEVLLNEVAPRPHNSGHYTIEACDTSQYEQHLRCILGLPLGSTAMRVGATVMVNVLGAPAGSAFAPEELGRPNPAWTDPASKQLRRGTDEAHGPTAMDATWDTCARALSVPGATVHWYGKRGSRPGRKVGHITITGPDVPTAFARVAQVMGPCYAEDPDYAVFFKAAAQVQDGSACV